MYATYNFTTVGTCLVATVVCVPVGGVVPEVGLGYYPRLPQISEVPHGLHALLGKLLLDFSHPTPLMFPSGLIGAFGYAC